MFYFVSTQFISYWIWYFIIVEYLILVTQRRAETKITRLIYLK